jgi:hypothetical protein
MSTWLYAGRVSHQRPGPRPHAFTYRVVMAWLDIADIDKALAAVPGASRRWFSPFRFRRGDHLGPAERPLDQCVRDLVMARTGESCGGPIRLLTGLGFMAHRFNPVSFYFCYDRDGRYPEWIIAEVNNTPWGEQHCYLLDARAQAGQSSLHFRHGKDFHVSPFLPMDTDYRWTIRPPGEELAMGIVSHREGRPVFRAALRLRRRRPTTRAMAAAFAAMPFASLKIVAAIHWQALRLWLKGAPFYSHPRTGER